MTENLKKALQTQKKATQQTELRIQGSLGIPLGGQRVVEVSNRNSFVYVRLRDNQNEVVQAFNNKVAASYDLPVFIQRISGRYEVLGVNTTRYQNDWNSSAPYLPQHGNVHSFYDGGGADITWIFSRQFMPLLASPIARSTGTSLFISQYPLLDNNKNWKTVGGTGTPSLLHYIPTGGNDSVMGLLYMDVPSGNPRLIINSGTPVSALITGASELYPYIPSPTDLSTQIPLAGFRISTGTTNITWDNLYDVRQFVHPIPTGTNRPDIDTIGFAGLYNGVPLGTGTFLNVRSPSSQAIFTISGSTFDLFVTGSASGGSPSGNAGGDLTGSYPNPSVFQAHLSTQTAPASVATGTLILSAMDEQGFPAAHLHDVQGNMMDVLRDNLFVVRNISGVGMTKGQVVYITGSTGQIPEVRLAKADSLGTLGQISVLYEDIGNNNYGRAMFSGHLEHANLSAFATGDELYVSPTVAGGLTATQPTNPNYSQIVGVVLNNGVGNGVLQVYSRAATLTPVVTKVLVTGSMYMNYDGSQPGTGQVTLFISGSGVTGGDAHNHTGSNGGQINFLNLSNIALPDGQITNYQLVTSITSNNQVIAIKGMDGNDPSPSNPISIRAGNTIILLTSALSVTINAAAGDVFGWDAGKIQANDAQLFVYIINNNGTAQLGASPCPNLTIVATNYYDGSQTGAAGHTNIVMSGTRNATNSCRVIGRVNVNQADNNNWQNPTTAKTINFPIFETDWLVWTPTHSRSGTNYTNLPTTNVAKYVLRRNIMFWEETHTQNAAPGGTGFQRLTAPIICLSANTGNGINGTTVVTVLPFISVGTNTITLFKYDGTAEATASQVYQGSGFYEAS